MKFQVTQKDIEKGQPCMASDCPIARSLLREFDYVTVDRDTIVAYRGKNPVVYRTPGEVSKFIEHFDEGKKVEPFEFELE